MAAQQGTIHRGRSVAVGSYRLADIALLWRVWRVPGLRGLFRMGQGSDGVAGCGSQYLGAQMDACLDARLFDAHRAACVDGAYVMRIVRRAWMSACVAQF